MRTRPRVSACVSVHTMYILSQHFTINYLRTHACTDASTHVRTHKHRNITKRVRVAHTCMRTYTHTLTHSALPPPLFGEVCNYIILMCVPHRTPRPGDLRSFRDTAVGRRVDDGCDCVCARGAGGSCVRVCTDCKFKINCQRNGQANGTHENTVIS